MKWQKLSPWFVRLWVLACAAGMVWAVWSSALAQTAAATNAPAGTNAPPKRAADKIADTVDRGFEKYQNELSFGLSNIEILQRPLWGNPRWQYLATAIYFALAFGVSKLLDYLIKTRLKAWASKTDTEWDDVLVGLADGPVKVIAFVILLHIGLKLFHWPATVEHYLSRMTFIIVAVSIIYVLTKAMDAVVGIWRKRLKPDGDREFNSQFLLLVGKALKVVICIVGALTLLQNLGFDITALLGSVSVLGLAFGLAAQDTVANLFGAVAVFMDRPFKVGDRIKVGGEVDGVVEEMGLRATRVRSVDGHLVTVPNKQVGNNTVTNITARPTIRNVMNIGITYDTPVPRVRRAVELLGEICRSHPRTADHLVHFDKFGDFQLNLNLVWVCASTDARENAAGLQDLNLAIKERFDAEKIEFAFPTQTILLPGKPA